VCVGSSIVGIRMRSTLRSRCYHTKQRTIGLVDVAVSSVNVSVALGDRLCEHMALT